MGGWSSVTSSTSARSTLPRPSLAKAPRCSTRTPAVPFAGPVPEERCDRPNANDLIRVCASARCASVGRPVRRLWLASVLWASLSSTVSGSAPAHKPQGTRWDRRAAGPGDLPPDRPGSEWRLHRQWFLDSAMADLLGSDFGLAEAHKLYACHDKLLAHKQALFSHSTQRWRDLFNRPPSTCCSTTFKRSEPLFSTKDYSHRIFLNKGIFAEVTLYYKDRT